MALSERMKTTRDAELAKLDAILAPAEAEKRDLRASEQREFDQVCDRVKLMNARVDELEADETRHAEARKNAARYIPGPATIGHEPGVYNNGQGHSYIRDAAFAQVFRTDDRGFAASERLRQNAIEQRAGDLTTVAGAGGEFAPPGWFISDFVSLARPGRVLADQLNHVELPAGVSSINIPSIVTGTAVAAVGTQNTAVQDTPAATSSVAAPVCTIAGAQVVSLQVIEQGPQNMDQIILGDLAADYARYMGSQCISGTAAAGQLRGVLNVAGIQSTTYTDASPVVVGVGKGYASTLKALQLINSNRYAPATALLMTPARWAWFCASVDSQNRPLIVPDAGAEVNAYGSGNLSVAQGAVGRLGGVPVYLDANIPTNLGGGTNQDVIIALRGSDITLYESHIRLEIMPQTYGNQMSVLVRAYNYAAIVARYPKAISTVGGTGLVTPVY